MDDVIAKLGLYRIVSDLAFYTSGSILWYKIGNGSWIYLTNGSTKYNAQIDPKKPINATRYGSEHWILKKNLNGCWAITQMEFNAGLFKFP